jgi:hypothetical protein
MYELFTAESAEHAAKTMKIHQKLSAISALSAVKISISKIC